MDSRSKFFYGWYILAASFFILFFNSGARSAFSVMFKSMIAEFGWNRSALSLAFFLNMTIFALTIAVAGRFYDRYGPKWVILLATLFLAFGYTLISTVTVLWQFYLYYGVLAAIGLGGTSVSLMATIATKWFDERRGLAVSISLGGHCLGQFALVPLFTLFALHFGWRTSFFLIGVIMLVVNTALAFLVIRGDPKHLGYAPYGSEREETIQGPIPSNLQGDDMGLKEAMHTPSFWFFLTFMFVCGCGDFLVMTHLIPYVTDLGISPSTGGNMLAWFGFMSLLGILIAGPASDRVGCKIPIVLTFLLRVLCFILILRYQSLVSLYIFSLVFGLTCFVTAPLTPILVSRLYGVSHLGYIAGFLNTLHHIGGGFWAYVGGWVFDQTGSYRLAFILSAVISLIAAFCAILVSEKRQVSPSRSGSRLNQKENPNDPR
jgi:MFS family permease